MSRQDKLCDVMWNDSCACYGALISMGNGFEKNVTHNLLSYNL